MPPTDTTFAARLRDLRIAAGLTQAELATLARISRRTVEDYEQGRRQPGWKAVQALAVALGAQPNDFHR